MQERPSEPTLHYVPAYSSKLEGKPGGGFGEDRLSLAANEIFDIWQDDDFTSNPNLSPLSFPNPLVEVGNLSGG